MEFEKAISKDLVVVNGNLSFNPFGVNPTKLSNTLK